MRERGERSRREGDIAIEGERSGVRGIEIGREGERYLEALEVRLAARSKAETRSR